MEHRLTDQQVADLIEPGAFVPPSIAAALALEVQASRLRIAALETQVDELEDRLQDAIWDAMGEDL
jgi:hypothetical protein